MTAGTALAPSPTSVGQWRCIVLRGFTGVSAGIVLLAAASGAAEASMRCGHEIVTPGDSVIRLLDLCGEPTVGNPALWFGDAVWIYNFGPDEFQRRVRLRDGRIRSIERLGRGVEHPHHAFQRWR